MMGIIKLQMVQEKAKLAELQQSLFFRHFQVCDGAPAGSARCHARVIANKRGRPQAATLPAGYGPVQFRGAYAVSGMAQTPTTIAIVDAYDHPRIKSDLDTYNSTFGLPFFPSCSATVTSGCFLKVNQNGSTSFFPPSNAGWALEIALDVETAHAMCSNCKLVLVEANSASYADLMMAVDQAMKQGATVISNSYGSNEFSSESTYDAHFSGLMGRAILFSSGDSGYGVEYPAASQYVTAVGGTTLSLGIGNTYGGEVAWKGAGSGCSAYESKPGFQSFITACGNRTVADVSADADPNTGAAVYDSIRYQGQRGWFQVGGTSLATPLVAGVYALAGVPPTAQGNTLPYVNGTAANLHDVVMGSNGTCGTLLCQAGAGYDGPTGLGSPNGMSAF